MKYFHSKSNTGFTLLEALLYLAIAGTVLYFISGFAFNSIFGKAKIETFQSINQNSQSVLDELSNTIGNSEGVNGFIGNVVPTAPPSVGCVATGGDVVDTTSVPGYTIHKFTTVGTSNFTVTSGSCNAEVLVVAGGGGGGGDVGGGGGGGQVISISSYPITSQAYPIVVASMTGYPSSYNKYGDKGGDSSFGSLSALGGGGGNGRTGGGATAPNTGWTGGGGSYDVSAGNAGSGGGAGGNSYGGGTTSNGNGGGGGTVGPGSAGISSKGGNGGSGYSSNISGSTVTYGGGGGGSYYASGTAGTGTDGGGNGGNGGTSGQDGIPNRGGGGGGGPSSLSVINMGRGSSGVVIVRYAI